MKRVGSVSLVLACALAASAPRWADDKKGAERVRISIYRVAPGQQLEFLRWWAAQDEVAREAGVAPVQVYAHLEGDDWDYLLLRPLTTPDQERKLDEIAARKGLKRGLASALEFRELLASHSDTLVTGPLTAQELVAAAEP